MCKFQVANFHFSVYRKLLRWNELQFGFEFHSKFLTLTLHFRQTLDEVQGEVLKYVTVIATPLVLQGEDHPPTWTHAFKDYFSVNLFFLTCCLKPSKTIKHFQDDDDNDDDDNNREQPARLMIAVGVPAFDKKMNNQNGTLKSARLLG